MHEARVATAPDGTPIVERLTRFGPEQLFAIETVREDDGRRSAGGVFVLQPGSAEHRVGPGRFQVLAARELAARGTRAIRFDRRITGDSTPVRVGEPNLIFAEEWIDDVDSLVEHLVGDAPVAHVGLCSGAWVAARMADLRPDPAHGAAQPHLLQAAGHGGGRLRGGVPSRPGRPDAVPRR